MATAPSSPLIQSPALPLQPPTAHLQAPALYANDFADTLGPHIQWLAGNKVSHAHIQLTPQDMGPIEVRLQLDGDQLQAQFNSAEPDVCRALEHSLPRLRELLGEHGLQLTQSNISQQSPQQRSASPQAHSADSSTAQDEDVPGATSRPQQTATTLNLIDAWA